MSLSFAGMKIDTDSCLNGIDSLPSGERSAHAHEVDGGVFFPDDNVNVVKAMHVSW